jgi:hypothetical protein
MLARVILALLLATNSAFGQWQRQIRTMSGESTDSPAAHGMDYFRSDPCLRNDPKVTILQCAYGATAAELARNVHTDLRLVGKAGTLTIYELDYFLWSRGERPGVRSILVETSPNQLHEIHLTEVSAGWVYPAELIETAGQQLLKAKFEDGGIYFIVHEDYFSFGKGRPEPVDLEPIWQAARRLVPKPFEVYQPSSKIDFSLLQFQAGTENIARNDVGPKVGCCDGKVSVTFRLVDGHIVVTGSKYDPEGWNK